MLGFLCDVAWDFLGLGVSLVVVGSKCWFGLSVLCWSLVLGIGEFWV